jgi:hypothetical protein
VAIGQMGPGDRAEHLAAQQTVHLMEVIRVNPRMRELAINPLMLTVVALVYRDRVKLPARRVELYAEAVDDLIGQVKGVFARSTTDARAAEYASERFLNVFEETSVMGADMTNALYRGAVRRSYSLTNTHQKKPAGSHIMVYDHRIMPHHIAAVALRSLIVGLGRDG